MTLLSMYDACEPGNIPPGSDLVAGYVDPGNCQWPSSYLMPSAWAPRRLVTITRTPTWRANVLDVEPGAASANQVGEFLQTWWPSGGGVIYCDRSDLDAVTSAMQSAGLYASSGIWVAAPNYQFDGSWPGNPSVIAVQSGYFGTYDTSTVVSDWWWCEPSLEGEDMQGIIVQQPNEDQEWVVATDLSSKTPLADPTSAQALVALGMPRIGYQGGPPGLSAAQLAAIPTVQPSP